jgi:hypothetical protein
MHSKLKTGKFKRIAIAVVVVTVLGGCAKTKSLVSSMGRSSTPSDDAIILGAPDAEHYLSELYELSAGDPRIQAEIFADAKAGATLTSGPQTNLRYALVLATPGHPGFNPEVAQSMLRDVLLQQSILTSTEISLATIHLNSVEQLNLSGSDARRAIASSSLAATTEEAAIMQRLAVAESENQRLRSELANAEEKLDAITSIERSIREQDQ